MFLDFLQGIFANTSNWLFDFSLLLQNWVRRVTAYITFLMSIWKDVPEFKSSKQAGHEMEPAPSIQLLVYSWSNTDEQEQRGVEKHHPAENGIYWYYRSFGKP